MKLFALLPFVHAGMCYHPGESLDTDEVEMTDGVRKELLANGKASAKPVKIVNHDDPVHVFAEPVTQPEKEPKKPKVV